MLQLKQNSVKSRFSVISRITLLIYLGVTATMTFTLTSISSLADGIECQVFPELAKVYLRSHYAHRELNEKLRERTVEQFIKMIDSSKTVLLESEVKKWNKELVKLFDEAPKGNCSRFKEVYDVLVQRAKSNEQFIKKFMGPAYKLDESVEYIMDPEKRSYASNNASLEKTLQVLAHFQMSNYLAADSTLDESKKQLIHRYELITKRTEERDPSRLLELFISAFSLALDPHSSYLSYDELEDFQIQMQLSLEGIGASLSSDDGYTVVEEIIPGGSADRAGVLKPKDKIIAVSQEGQKSTSVIDMDLRDVVKLIRGKKGSKVTLTLLRKAPNPERLEVTIVRDKIDIKDQAAQFYIEKKKLGKKEIKVGVIELPSFYGGGKSDSRNAYRDVKELVRKANKEKVNALVLNLSRNGGGLLEDAVRISGLFLREGGIVATQSTNGKVDVLSDEDSTTAYRGPLIILTSRLSASASEIFAGALKDYGRALIVGSDHTFGKGSVQLLVPLPQKYGAMKVTTGMYFLPGGDSTQNQGVRADINLPSAYDLPEIGEADLPYALPHQKIKSFLSMEDANSKNPKERWSQIDQSKVQQLSELSKIRVKKDSKFLEIRKNLDEAEKSKGVVKLSEFRKKSETDKSKEKKEKNAPRKSSLERLREADAPYVAEVLNIISDWAQIDPTLFFSDSINELAKTETELEPKKSAKKMDTN